MFTLTIPYARRGGKAIPDGDIEIEYKALVDNTSLERLPTISSELLFYRIKAGILEGDFPDRKILFEFQGQTLNPLEPWPVGFCRVADEIFGRTWLALLNIVEDRKR